MKFHQLSICLVLTLPLFACQTDTGMPTPPATTPYTLNESEISAVVRGVKSALKDPDSAKFGQMKASTEGGGVKYVCGIVNAKNSFGGFIGDSPFVGVLGSLETEGKTLATFRLTSLGRNQDNTEIVVKMCRHYGVI